MTPAEVPAELVETACRARWEAEGSVFTGHNGDVAYTWDALAALFPVEADVHRRRERAALAAVLPLYGATVLAGAALHLRDIAAEMDAARPNNLLVGASVEATRQDAAILDEIAARLRAAETERTS